MYGGDVNQFANNRDNDSTKHGSPGDPNGNDTNIAFNRHSGKEHSEDKRRRGFLLVKSSSVNTVAFT